MSSFHVEHKLGREAARERVASLVTKHGIATQSTDGGYSGVLEKKLPFVGAVRAQFNVLEDRVELTVIEAPAFPSAETLRKLISDELARTLAN